MKKTNIILIIAIFVLSISLSCSSIKYVKTGNEYPPLSDEQQVEVKILVDKSQYDEIGIVDVGALSLEKRIQKAKEFARAKGGDTVVPAGYCDEKLNQRIKSGYVIQTFYILKKKENLSKIEKDEIKDNEIEESIKENNEIANNDIKTDIPYGTLLNDYLSLSGQIISAEMLPLRFYKVPPTLLEYGLIDYKLCLMKYGLEKKPVLVFIPKDKIEFVKQNAKKKSTITINFTPLGIYKDKYPVLKMENK